MSDRDRLVTVATFATSVEASLARGALEAAGIRAAVPGEGLGTFSRHRGALPVAQLQVAAADHDRALAILRRMDLHIAEPARADERRHTPRASEGRQWVATAKVLAAMLLALVILGLLFNARNRAGQLPFNTSRPQSIR